MSYIISKYKTGAFLLGLTFSLGFASCDDLIDPALENNRGLNYIYEHPTEADGLLSNAYTRLPNGSYSFSEVATDDAVINDAANNYRKMTVAGAWKSDFNPLETWRSSRTAIQYINLFLANIDNVKWNADSKINDMYRQRYLGEAYGLRAIFMYNLLRAHGGYDNSGQLLGVPLLTEKDGNDASLEVRATFKECMEQLIADAEKAISLLPGDYADVAGDVEYNRVLGTNFAGRVSGRIVSAVLCQATLMAASPAFADQSGVTMAMAADYLSNFLLKFNDGLEGFDKNGLEWYSDPDIQKLAGAECPKEVLWRTLKSESNNLEKDNFPPSLYGNGRVNPTQNLVDAFPMANGYPINDSRSNYSASNPYEGRDPRLSKYIIYNGQPCGINNTPINTQADNDANLDGINKDVSKSTRTGYYLKKLLRQDLNLDPNVSSSQYHYTARIRYTELYLDFAEAANEVANNPKSYVGSAQFSAYDVIKMIRKRALGLEEDPYLEECAQSQDKMRELIRNERRLELCFEGFRFWDLRRWKANLNEEAKGVSITNDGAGKKYAPLSVETRSYSDAAYYGPIPYDQVLNFPTLNQNKGW